MTEYIAENICDYKAERYSVRDLRTEFFLWRKSLPAASTTFPQCGKSLPNTSTAFPHWRKATPRRQHHVTTVWKVTSERQHRIFSQEESYSSTHGPCFVGEKKINLNTSSFFFTLQSAFGSREQFVCLLTNEIII